MTEFPRCAVCRVTIQPGLSAVFRPDGRVTHVECPEVSCPVCARRIFPGDPIRRNGEELLHGNCWVKRHRAMIAGGSGDAPWALIFERRAAVEAHIDARRFSEFSHAIADVNAAARAVRARSREARAISRMSRRDASASHSPVARRSIN